MLSGTESKTQVEAESQRGCWQLQLGPSVWIKSTEAELEHSCSCIWKQNIKRVRTKQYCYMDVRTTPGRWVPTIQLRNSLAFFQKLYDRRRMGPDHLFTQEANPLRSHLQPGTSASEQRGSECPLKGPSPSLKHNFQPQIF